MNTEPQTPPDATDPLGVISPEEERRRRLVAEQIARAYGKKHPEVAPASPRSPGFLDKWKRTGGVLGAIASALLVFGKYVLLAWKFVAASKFLLTGGTMLLSIVLEAFVYGWPIAVGIVLLIFVHECGHAWAGKRLGRPIGNMVFVPFMGAAVMIGRGKNVREDAYIGIMGPVVGTLGGVACVAIGFLTGQNFWFVLAQLCFFMNLFNLIPTAPLDGGWIAPIFSPKLLALGLVLLLPVAFLNPLVLLLALGSVPRIVAGWKTNGRDDPYFSVVTARDRWQFGTAYLGLAAFLALSVYFLHGRPRHSETPQSPARVAAIISPSTAG